MSRKTVALLRRLVETSERPFASYVGEASAFRLIAEEARELLKREGK